MPILLYIQEKMVSIAKDDVFEQINYPHISDDMHFASDELVAILHEKNFRAELLLPSLYGSLNNLKHDIEDKAKDILIAADIKHILHVIKLLQRYGAIAKQHPEYKLPWAAELEELFTVFTGHDDFTLETIIDKFLSHAISSQDLVPYIKAYKETLGSMILDIITKKQHSETEENFLS